MLNAAIFKRSSFKNYVKIYPEECAPYQLDLQKSENALPWGIGSKKENAACAPKCRLKRNQNNF